MPNETSKMGIEPFEKTGQWWIHGTAEKVRGILSRDNTGNIRLKFSETISAIPSAVMYLPDNSTILGDLDEGQKITLLHTYGGNPESHHYAREYNIENVINVSHYASGYLRGNIHLVNETNLRFSSLQFVIAESSSWLGVHSESKDEGDYLVIRIPNHRNLYCYKNQGIKITLSPSPSLKPIEPSGKGWVCEYAIREPILVQMEFEKAKGIDELINLSLAVRDFFRLVIHNEISFDGIFVSNGEIKRRGQSSGMRSDMDFYYRGVLSPLDIGKALSIVRLTHAEIGRKFPDLMFSWIRKHHEIKPILNHYFGVFDAPILPGIIQFQILMQGVEAFCKKTEELKKQAVARATQRRKREKEEPSLFDYLSVFVAPFQENFSLSDDDQNLLIEKMGAIRNKWVHEATMHEKTGLVLMIINNFLKRLLRLHIWRWMGMDMKQIARESRSDTGLANHDIRAIMPILRDIPSNKHGHK